MLSYFRAQIASILDIIQQKVAANESCICKGLINPPCYYEKKTLEQGSLGFVLHKNFENTQFITGISNKKYIAFLFWH